MIYNLKPIEIQHILHKARNMKRTAKLSATIAESQKINN